jgi:uncharacterized protein YprB with RNaseH-like and TPR domain
LPVAAPRLTGGLRTLAKVQQTAEGPLHLVEARAGRWPSLDGPGVAALACSGVLLDVSRPLFLDTETTGLAGGTGTLPFLVGVALEDQGQVRVEQAHLEAPGRERVVLAWLRGRLAGASLLVTFNGKSFDWPLLRSRYVMNRLPVPPLPPHLDLLHCARRLFRHDTTRHTLTALERLALDVHRQDDLPGAQVPAVWFDYLRTGQLGGLRRVLRHNHRDVVTMVELLAWCLEAWHGQRGVSVGTGLALARLAAGRGDDARAWRLLPAHAGSLEGARLELQACLLRRQGALREAAVALEAAVPLSAHPGRLRLALARLYEHQLQDFAAARRHALGATAEEPPQRHQRRLARLGRRASFSPVPPA